jgi:hypothetical protein
MKKNIIAYWVTTAIVALVMALGGVFDMLLTKEVIETLAHLGYPPYFGVVIGFWKVAGAVAIVAPRLPRLKEWAYAGIIFDLTGAIVSHLASGDGVVATIGPLAFIGMTVASWYLRPADRRL